MTDEEKILKFAGFTEVDLPMYCHDAENDGDSWHARLVIIRPYWVKDSISFRERPDTTDLTWLFKWCVPNIKGSSPPGGEFGDIWKGINFDYHDDGTITCEIEVSNINGSGHAGIAEGRAKTEGEALRAAILALIKDGDALTSNGGMNDR